MTEDNAMMTDFQINQVCNVQQQQETRKWPGQTYFASSLGISFSFSPIYTLSWLTH